MKLSKEGIQFIDAYLIKNGVKFWDIRIELLDHIVLAVEEKMQTKGIIFEDALLEVHEGFGNELGCYMEPTFKERLYYSNSGFKKFVKQKTKAIKRKQRNKYWSLLKMFFKTSSLLLELILFILIVFSIYRISPKVTLIVVLTSLVTAEVLKLIYIYQNKGLKKSLNISLSNAYGSIFLANQYSLIMLFKSVFGSEEYSFYLILFYCLVFPFIRTGFTLFGEVSKTYKKHYVIHEA